MKAKPPVEMWVTILLDENGNVEDYDTWKTKKEAYDYTKSETAVYQNRILIAKVMRKYEPVLTPKHKITDYK